MVNRLIHHLEIMQRNKRQLETLNKLPATPRQKGYNDGEISVYESHIKAIQDILDGVDPEPNKIKKFAEDMIFQDSLFMEDSNQRGDHSKDGYHKGRISAFNAVINYTLRANK